jgi:hypothetical protein
MQIEEWGEQVCRPYHGWGHRWVSTLPSSATLPFRKIRIGQEASRGEALEGKNLLNVGRNCVFFMCKPPRDLAHLKKKRYLFWAGKVCFCVFVLKNNACGHTL